MKMCIRDSGVTEYTEKIDILEDNVINIQLDGEGLNQYTLRYTDIVEPVQFLLEMTLNKQLKDCLLYTSRCV